LVTCRRVSDEHVTRTTPSLLLPLDDAARSTMKDAQNAPATPCEVGVHVLCCCECHCVCHDDAD
jgi:hypothetical protein